jgi:multidrug efflux pump subunit AcrA (membrane-fusion protein)
MSDFDPADFVDDDFQARKAQAASGASSRAPTREEVDTRVSDTQQKLVELKRAQEELERERSALEETRRRQMEFQTGRHEMIHNLTRGLGLLEEAEFTARRDAEQMAKTIADFRDVLSKIEVVREETWTTENFNVELTRALTSIENGRMEWNAARLKFPILTGEKPPGVAAGEASAPEAISVSNRSFSELCKLGLALTWPLALIALAALGVFVAILLSHR